MTINNSKLWKCSYCIAEALQGPPRASSMPPIPPEGWFRVLIISFVPAHSVEVGAEKQKVGDAVNTVQKVVCPACRHAKVAPLI